MLSSWKKFNNLKCNSDGIHYDYGMGSIDPVGSSRILLYISSRSINYILWNGQFSFVVSHPRVSYSSLSISHLFHALQQCETPCERGHPFHMISTGFSHKNTTAFFHIICEIPCEISSENNVKFSQNFHLGFIWSLPVVIVRWKVTQNQ